MSNCYTPKNQSLNPLIPYGKALSDRHGPQLSAKAIDADIIKPDLDLEDITTDIRMIVIGNVFEWCLKSGEADFEGNMRRTLRIYLDGLF